MENIVEITSHNYKAYINMTRGANCVSLRNEKYKASILREADYSKELDNPYLYGMPILYPVNRISGGSFIFEGREYRFPVNEPATNCHLHGVIHNEPFEIVAKENNSIKCGYRQEKTSFFPHSFKIEITYSLGENGLEQITEIFNLSDRNMPNFLGFHTTFNIPFVEGSSVDGIVIKADLGEEIERNMKNYLPTGNILPIDDITRKIKGGKFNPFEKIISRHYKADCGGVMEIKDRTAGIKMVYENDDKFGWRLIYNGNADEYICLEPMTCMANCQNSPFERELAGFDYIEPDSSKVYISKIRLEELQE